MKQHHLLAFLGRVQERETNAISVIYKRLQKAGLYSGRRITYTALEDTDLAAAKPPEGNQVQFYVHMELEELQAHLTELYNLTATRDWANLEARGTIKVDGQVILADVPVMFLLWLKTELHHLRAELNVLPTLDSYKEWTEDEATGGFRTETEWQWSSRRVKKVLVRYEHTDEHPAQTELIEEEVPVARKETTDFSGAIRPTYRAALLKRADKLLDAVAVAVEEANSMDVTEQHVAPAIFGYLFG
jgi:hypothetical protein